jgi:integrase/recombinase XerC
MLTDDFLEYLKTERNYSSLTLRSYRDDLVMFKAYIDSLGEGIDWNTVDADIIRSWVVDLVDRCRVEPISVGRKLSALRSFYRYLILTGRCTVNPAAKVKSPKKPKMLPYFVKDDDMDRLIDGDTFENSFYGVRDRMIIMVFFSTGVRLSELLSMRLSDVDFYSRTIKVLGKRNKERVIPFHDELCHELERYIELRGETFPGIATDALFVSSRGLPISRSSVEKIVSDNLSKVTSIKKKSPHVLRHSFATSMLNHKADIVAIKDLLGHESLSTTEVYTHTSFEELKNVYKDAHPRS